MRSTVKNSFVALVLACLFGMPGAAFAQKTITLRIAHAMPETHGYHIWATAFKEALNQLAPGQFDVQIFPNAQLGSETEYLETMKFGSIDGAVLGRHGQVDPRLEVLNLPMIYRDAKHVDAVLRSDSAVQKQLDAIMYDHGYKVLGWGELGFRAITSNDRPIHKAADLAGLDIRVPNVQPWLVAFKAWGANPTPLDFSEVYSALQQGVVDAQENPVEIILTSRFYEVQNTISLTDHAYIPSEFLLSKRSWEKLPAELQSVVQKAADIGRDKQVDNTRKANAAMIAQLKANGMNIVTDVDKESFRAGAEEAYRKYEGSIGKDLIKAVQEAH